MFIAFIFLDLVTTVKKEHLTKSLAHQVHLVPRMKTKKLKTVNSAHQVFLKF